MDETRRGSGLTNYCCDKCGPISVFEPNLEWCPRYSRVETKYTGDSSLSDVEATIVYYQKCGGKLELMEPEWQEKG